MTNSSDDTLSRSRIVGFILMAGPIAASTAPVSAYLPAYYSEHLGLSLAGVGMLFFSIRAIDFLFDAMAGILIDRHPFSGGKYRPWQVLGLITLVAGIWMLYMPPPVLVSLAFAFTGGALLYFGFSFAQVAHQAWSSAIARHDADRVAIFGYREICVIFGILVVFMAPAVAERGFHVDFATKVHVLGYTLIIGLVLTGAIGLWSLRAKDEGVARSVREQASNAEHLSLAAMWRVLRDAEVLEALLMFMLGFFALIATSSVSVFLIKGAFGRPDLVAQLQALYFIAAVAAIFVWLRLGKRWGEWTTLRIFGVTAILAQLSVFLPWQVHATWALALHFAILGAQFGAAPFLLRSILGRIGRRMADTDGADAQGILFSACVLAEKIGSSVAVLLSLSMLGWLGFVPTKADDPQTRWAILTVYLAVPIASYVLMSIIMFRHRRSGD